VFSVSIVLVLFGMAAAATANPVTEAKLGNFELWSKTDPMTDRVRAFAATQGDKVVMSLACEKGPDNVFLVSFTTTAYLGGMQRSQYGRAQPSNRMFDYRLDTAPATSLMGSYDDTGVTVRVSQPYGANWLNKVRGSSKLTVKVYGPRNETSYTQVFDITGIDAVISQMATQCGTTFPVAQIGQ
jgi:hypothetical protein